MTSEPHDDYKMDGERAQNAGPPYEFYLLRTMFHHHNDSSTAVELLEEYERTRGTADNVHKITVHLDKLNMEVATLCCYYIRLRESNICMEEVVQVVPTLYRAWPHPSRVRGVAWLYGGIRKLDIPLLELLGKVAATDSSFYFPFRCRHFDDWMDHTIKLVGMVCDDDDNMEMSGTDFANIAIWMENHGWLDTDNAEDVRTALKLCTGRSEHDAKNAIRFLNTGFDPDRKEAGFDPGRKEDSRFDVPVPVFPDVFSVTAG